MIGAQHEASPMMAGEKGIVVLRILWSAARGVRKRKGPLC
jgi:hypothetical protein